jgi:hypothetical protein
MPDFSKLAYAKLNLQYDKELFVREYDEVIYPHGYPITNNLNAVGAGGALNKVWGMVPPEEYNKGDIYMQEGSASYMKYIKRERPGWKMVQLMETDLANTENKEFLEKFSKVGGPSFRNETLDLDFTIKKPFENMQMWKWIQDNLPFQKINSIHCVSLEPGGFSIIHRDMKGLYSSMSSAGESRLFKQGFVVIALNISNGGAPLYWSLDGKDALNCYKADDDIYLSNDYFMHGVPIVTSRRRQVRVAGIPKPEMWELFDKQSIIDIGDNYQFDATYATPHVVEFLKGKENETSH